MQALNLGTSTLSERDPLVLVEALWKRLSGLKAHYLAALIQKKYPEGVKEQVSYLEALDYARALQDANVLSLSKRAQNAFWINLYNAMVAHAILDMEIRHSVRDVRGFFDKVAYVVQGEMFALNDIEHGLLRGNRRAPYALFRRIGSRSSKQAFVLELDPRVHFALNCGASSCPPISTYDPEHLEEKLEKATGSFMTGGGVELDVSVSALKVSKLFQWYKSDFGDVRAFIAMHHPREDVRSFLENRQARLSISYLPYHWGLI